MPSQPAPGQPGWPQPPSWQRQPASAAISSTVRPAQPEVTQAAWGQPGMPQSPGCSQPQPGATSGTTAANLSAQPVVTQANDGTLTIEFSGCNSGTVSYDIASLGITGEIPIERIALDNVSLCESLAGE